MPSAKRCYLRGMSWLEPAQEEMVGQLENKNEMGMARLADAATLRRPIRENWLVCPWPKAVCTGSWSGWTVLGGLTKHQNKGWARATGQSSPTS